MVTRLRFALALVIVAPTNLACPGTCVGAGCEDAFDASFTGLFFGAAARPSAASPLDADATLVGDSDEGTGWDLELASGRIVVGSPADGTVRGFGPDLAPGDTLLADAPGTLADEGGAVDSFGASVAVLPDVDGDGVDELLVGAPTFDAGSTHDGGAVYLFAGLGSLDSDVSGATPTVRVSGESTSLHFGDLVRACGDMDGDGLSEWVAAAPLGGESSSLAGEVALASSRDLLSLDPEVLMGDLGASSSKTRSGAIFTGSSVGARAGSALDCGNDMTGDGLADLWIGAPFADGTHDGEGAAYLIASSAKGSPAAGDLDTSALAVLRGEVQDAWLGSAIATGDFDGDGIADVAVGAPGASAVATDAPPASPGQVLLWRGASFRADPKSRQDVRITGAEDGDRFGASVAFADTDGDGFDDLLVGAPHHNPDANNADSAFQSGALYVFEGAAGELPANLGVDDASVVIVEAAQFLRTGERIAAGDYDGDGEAEIGVVNRYDPANSPFP